MKTVVKMIIKLIACEVFTREVCLCVANSPHVIDVEFTPKGAHNDPDYFRGFIQKIIDSAGESDKKYDAIALCLGLCGNSTVGLKSPGIQLIIPRAHDCCTLFLGSKNKFKEYFGDRPSSSFNSAGYLEHGGDYIHEAETIIKKTGLDEEYSDLVEKYGEDNAKFIWETLHTQQDAAEIDNKLFYIEMPEFEHLGYAEKCAKQALTENKEFVKLEGNIRLIKKLIYGEWDDEEFLTVKPGEETSGVYDLEKIITAK